MDNRRLDKERLESQNLKTQSPMTASGLLVRIISIGIVWFVIYQLSSSMKVIMYVATGLFVPIKIKQLITRKSWQYIKQPYEKTWFVFGILVPLGLCFFTIYTANVRETEARAVGEQMVILINNYHDTHGAYPPTDAIEPIKSDKIDYDGKVYYARWQDGTPNVRYSKPMMLWCDYRYNFFTEQWEERCD